MNVKLFRGMRNFSVWVLSLGLVGSMIGFVVALVFSSFAGIMGCIGTLLGVIGMYYILNGIAAIGYKLFSEAEAQTSATPQTPAPRTPAVLNSTEKR